MNHEKVGEYTGGLASAILCYVHWQQMQDTMVITAIATIVGGTLGFVTTKLLNLIWKKITGDKK